MEEHKMGKIKRILCEKIKRLRVEDELEFGIQRCEGLNLFIGQVVDLGQNSSLAMSGQSRGCLGLTEDN